MTGAVKHSIGLRFLPLFFLLTVVRLPALDSFLQRQEPVHFPPMVLQQHSDTVFFGAVPLTAVAIKAITIVNSTTEFQTVSLRTFTGPDSSFRLVNQEDTAFFLLPGAERFILLSFVPRSIGGFIGLLTVEMESQRSTVQQNFVLIGEGTARNLIFEQTGFPKIVFVGEAGPHDTIASEIRIINRIAIARAMEVWIEDTTAAFSLVSADPVLPPAGAARVQITFHPPAAGVFTATLFFRIDTLETEGQILLLGRGREENPPFSPLLQFPALIDFGDLPVGVAQDTVVPIINLSDSTVLLHGFYTKNSKVFRILAPLRDSIRIPPQDTAFLTLQFLPDKEGLHQDNALFFSASGMQYNVQLLGRGVPYSPAFVLRVGTVTAEIGDTVVVPIIFSADSLSLAALPYAVLDSMVLFLRWNATVLLPRDRNIRIDRMAREERAEIKMRYIPPSASQMIQDTVLLIPFLVTLGDMPTAAVMIDSAWFQLRFSAQRLPIAFFEQGSVHVADVWYFRNVPRLVNPFAGNLRVSIAPYPLRSKSEVRIDGADPRELDIRVFHLDGTYLFSVPVPLEEQSSSLSVELHREMFPTSGLYLLVCRYKQHALTRLLVVE